MKAAALAMLLQATAYVPANNVGAVGEPLHAGISCAVPRSHKHLLRTWILVNGRPWYVADITGPKTRSIDLAVDNRDEALAYGRRKVEVTR